MNKDMSTRMFPGVCVLQGTVLLLRSKSRTNIRKSKDTWTFGEGVRVQRQFFIFLITQSEQEKPFSLSSVSCGCLRVETHKRTKAQTHYMKQCPHTNTET